MSYSILIIARSGSAPDLIAATSIGSSSIINAHSLGFFSWNGVQCSQMVDAVSHARLVA